MEPNVYNVGTQIFLLIMLKKTMFVINGDFAA